MHVKAGVALEPSGHRRVLMGGVIVGDDVDVGSAGVCSSMVLRKASHS